MRFSEWLNESETETRGRLEAAVRDYMLTKPPPERCYYVPHPSKMNFDPENPKHVEDELGADYDRSFKVIARKQHPTAFTCSGVAEGLVKFLKERGFAARKVAGWYGKTGRGFHAGYAPRLDSASPPQGFGSRPQEHWWVEADGLYVDLTSAQFHPLDPHNQRDLVIRDKRGALEDGEYAAVRRFPLGRSVPLPPNVIKMTERIASLKKFSGFHSKRPYDAQRVADWILKNAERYELERWRAEDIVRSISDMEGFYFSDKMALERLFGEGFDDIEEDDSLKTRHGDFSPPKAKVSRGTVRLRGRLLSLTSTHPDDLEKNMKILMDLVAAHFPSAEMGEPRTGAMNVANGGQVHYMDASVEGVVSPYDNKAFWKAVRDNGFREGS